jgi:hypothetical protein
MQFMDALSRRPHVLPPTLPLVRVRDSARGVFLANAPIFFGTHWRIGRSFPCMLPLLGACPWCTSSERRDHAYIPVMLGHPGSRPTRDLLELPPSAFCENPNVYGKWFIAQRRSKKAPISIEVEDRKPEQSAPPPAIAADHSLRTLAKVFSLPDPLNFQTEAEWLLAVRLRIEHPDYSPAKHAKELHP